LGSRGESRKSSRRLSQREASRRFKRNKLSRNGGIKKAGGRKKRRSRKRKVLPLDQVEVVSLVAREVKVEEGEGAEVVVTPRRVGRKEGKGRVHRRGKHYCLLDIVSIRGVRRLGA
jgi:hypothetical protein